MIGNGHFYQKSTFLPLAKSEIHTTKHKTTPFSKLFAIFDVGMNEWILFVTTKRETSEKTDDKLS